LIREHDRIDVIADASGTPEYATIAVKKISSINNQKHVEVSLLFCNK
jgi:predicted homoserine dehydrogenase-like protein